MKNIKILGLATIMLASALFVSCGDDDTKRKNILIFNGVEIEIGWAGINTGDLADGNYEIGFLPTDLTAPQPWNEPHYFMIQVSSEWDGIEVDLTQVDNEFDWSWFVEYYKEASGENAEINFYGNGSQEIDFRDVSGGSFTIRAIDLDEYVFEVDFNIDFNGDIYEGYYKGTLQTYTSGLGRQ
jgi:hypothetical protein